MAGIRRPLIVVDWSDFELGRVWVMLKAAVPIGGRAISLFERVLPFKRYNGPGDHRILAKPALDPAGRMAPILVTEYPFGQPRQ